MPIIIEVKQETQKEIVVGNDIYPFEDKKTGAKTAMFVFQFPDGTNGVVCITKLFNKDDKVKWVVQDDIKSFVLNFTK